MLYSLEYLIDSFSPVEAEHLKGKAFNFRVECRNWMTQWGKLEGKEPPLHKINIKFNEVEGKKVCLSAQEHTLRYKLSIQFSRSVMSDPFWPHESACQASLSITNARSSLRFISIESMMPSSHLILCRPLLLLPPIPPSIRVFSN